MIAEEEIKKQPPEIFDRHMVTSTGEKSAKNPSTSNNEPFDEGQFEQEKELPGLTGSVAMD